MVKIVWAARISLNTCNSTFAKFSIFLGFVRVALLTFKNLWTTQPKSWAGMVKWYHKSLPSLRCGFDSRYPLQGSFHDSEQRLLMFSAHKKRVLCAPILMYSGRNLCAYVYTGVYVVVPHLAHFTLHCCVFSVAATSVCNCKWCRKDQREKCNWKCFHDAYFPWFQCK